eukprot:scaffold447_cov307-Pinguiococcus_pyrenoidosus.AAC.66
MYTSYAAGWRFALGGGGFGLSCLGAAGGGGCQACASGAASISREARLSIDARAICAACMIGGGGGGRDVGRDEGRAVGRAVGRPGLFGGGGINTFSNDAVLPGRGFVGAEASGGGGIIGGGGVRGESIGGGGMLLWLTDASGLIMPPVRRLARTPG